MYCYDLMCLSTLDWNQETDWYKMHVIVSTARKQKTCYASVLIHEIEKPIIKF